MVANGVGSASFSFSIERLLRGVQISLAGSFSPSLSFSPFYPSSKPALGVSWSTSSYALSSLSWPGNVLPPQGGDQLLLFTLSSLQFPSDSFSLLTSADKGGKRYSPILRPLHLRVKKNKCEIEGMRETRDVRGESLIDALLAELQVNLVVSLWKKFVGFDGLCLMVRILWWLMVECYLFRNWVIVAFVCLTSIY